MRRLRSATIIFLFTTCLLAALAATSCSHAPTATPTVTAAVRAVPSQPGPTRLVYGEPRAIEYAYIPTDDGICQFRVSGTGGLHPLGAPPAKYSIDFGVAPAIATDPRAPFLYVIDAEGLCCYRIRPDGTLSAPGKLVAVPTDRQIEAWIFAPDGRTLYISTGGVGILCYAIAPAGGVRLTQRIALADYCGDGAFSVDPVSQSLYFGWMGCSPVHNKEISYQRRFRIIGQGRLVGKPPALTNFALTAPIVDAPRRLLFSGNLVFHIRRDGSLAPLGKQPLYVYAVDTSGDYVFATKPDNFSGAAPSLICYRVGAGARLIRAASTATNDWYGFGGQYGGGVDQADMEPTGRFICTVTQTQRDNYMYQLVALAKSGARGRQQLRLVREAQLRNQSSFGESAVFVIASVISRRHASGD